MNHFKKILSHLISTRSNATFVQCQKLIWKKFPKSNTLMVNLFVLKRSETFRKISFLSLQTTVRVGVKQGQRVYVRQKKGTNRYEAKYCDRSVRIAECQLGSLSYQLTNEQDIFKADQSQTRKLITLALHCLGITMYANLVLASLRRRTLPLLMLLEMTPRCLLLRETPRMLPEWRKLTNIKNCHNHQVGNIQFKYSTVGFIKITMIQGSITEGEGDFGATFGVKTDQFTRCSVASQFWVGCLILDPGLVQ